MIKQLPVTSICREAFQNIQLQSPALFSPYKFEGKSFGSPPWLFVSHNFLLPTITIWMKLFSWLDLSVCEKKKRKHSILISFLDLDKKLNCCFQAISSIDKILASSSQAWPCYRGLSVSNICSSFLVFSSMFSR